MNWSLRNSRLLDIVSQVYVDDPKKYGRRWQLLLVMICPFTLLLLYWAFMNARVNALPAFEVFPASAGVVAAAGEGAWPGQKDWIVLREGKDTYTYRAYLTSEQLVKARAAIGQPATVRWADQWPPFFPFPYRRMFHLVARQETVLDYATEVQEEQNRRSFFILLEYLCIAQLLSALFIPWAPILKQSILHRVYVVESLARAPRRTKLGWILGMLGMALLLQSLPCMMLPDQMDESQTRTIQGVLTDFHKSGIRQANIAFTISSDRESETFNIKAALPSAEQLVGTMASREIVEVKWYPGFRDELWSENSPISISISGKEISSLAWGRFAYQTSVQSSKRYGYLSIAVLIYLILAPWFYHIFSTIREVETE